MAEPENNDGLVTEVDEEQLAEQMAELVAEQEEEQKPPLQLEVKIDKSGTCKRHVTVSVSREDIDRYVEDFEADARRKNQKIPC